MDAVFVGRFQPFHLGHFRVVEEYQEEFGDFSLVMGSAGKSRTPENPLTAGERKEIIRSCFPEIKVLELEDEGSTEEDNRQWVEKLEEETGSEVVISQNDLVKRLVQEYTDMELVEQDLYDPEKFSATEVRRRIREGEEWKELVPDCAIQNIKDCQEVLRETKEA